MDPVQLLKKSPLSLSEVSRRSGVSRNTLNLWLRGTAQPSLAGLEKVMRVLGYEVSVSVHRTSDAAPRQPPECFVGTLRVRNRTLKPGLTALCSGVTPRPAAVATRLSWNGPRGPPILMAATGLSTFCRRIP
ncbi:helix-turn-helix transcriptional regulator [Corynebacterium guaraldiae]|uniref:helix-turn-helix domain-containing protein n=1 Tax=Corynebacterium guaraldiae TaxID=3051103 RepID=UPI001177D039|nr:helix-turn-helix transcriptional regulator [Corynebacterium guaraldiae]